MVLVVLWGWGPDILPADVAVTTKTVIAPSTTCILIPPTQTAASSSSTSPLPPPSLVPPALQILLRASCKIFNFELSKLLEGNTGWWWWCCLVLWIIPWWSHLTSNWPREREAWARLLQAVASQVSRLDCFPHSDEKRSLTQISHRSQHSNHFL